MADEIVLIRHGQTSWSAAGRHTGRTDVELDEEGRDQVRGLATLLAGRRFALVLTSPLVRASATWELLGREEAAVTCPELVEWDYGQAEGLTTAEMRATVPGWRVWTHPPEGGETVEEVGARADAVLERVAAVEGSVALVGHRHQLGILVARWLGLDAVHGGSFPLASGAISVLAADRGIVVVQALNTTPG